MKRAALFLALGIGTMLVLPGCTGVVIPPGSTTPVFSVLAHIVRGTTKVIFEVVGSSSTLFEWDFGDGTTLETEIPLVHHDFPELGRYGVIVVAVGRRGPGGGGDVGTPGPTDPIHTPGDGTTMSTFVIVDLTRGDEMRPCIRITNFMGQPATGFLPYTRVTFDAGCSFVPGCPLSECAFRWRIVRIDPLTGEELGFPWGSGGQLLEPRPIVSTEPVFTVSQIPGPSCCVSEVWTFKVTLEVWDATNNYAVSERRILVGCSP